MTVRRSRIGAMAAGVATASILATAMTGTSAAAVPAAAPAAGNQATAAAKAGPAVGIKLGSSAAYVGSRVRVSFGVLRSPTGSRVLVQRTFGTASAWRTLAWATVGKRTSYNGSLTVAAPPMGSYLFRTVLVAPVSGRWVTKAVSPSKRVHSYGTVSLAQIMNETTRTVNIGGRLFRYVAYHGSDTWRFLHFDRTSCSSARLTLGKDSAGGSTNGSVTVVQETADQKTLTAWQGQVTSATFNLSGDAADFNLWDTSYDSSYVYVNGTFLCWTADGKR